MRADNAHPCIIPPYCTGILQLCDAGIYKPLKYRIKKKVFSKRRERYALLEPGQLMPTLTGKEILC